MASFALMALGGGRAQLEGAVKYFVLSLLSSVIFLTAVGLLYGATGTLNLARLSQVVPERLTPGLRDALAMLFLGAFGLKAAVFPLFAWLPASYPTAPAPVSAIFAGLLTKVGVYALVRTFTLVFPWEGSVTVVLPVVAGLTMVTGVLGAASQTGVRRILSFHIVSQIGYMVLGLAWATPLALAGATFYLVHHIVTKTNLFLVAGLVQRLRGTEELARLGGLAARPLVAVLFLVPALSLAGVPPLSGFWAKLLIVRAGLAVEAWWLVGVAAGTGLLTVYSMTKIWSEAFWKPAPPEEPTAPPRGVAARAEPAGPLWTLVAPIALLAAVTVGLGLAAGPVIALADRAAEQLANPALYVEAVLGGGRG
jgi:multicomponent Na+:H+ antiporter subunit D